MIPDFSDATLIKLAGKPAFERGREYFSAGCVIDCRQKGNKVSGVVRGSEQYNVELQLGKQGLDGHCNCPASENMDFCKHCVALALHVREQQQHTEQLESGNPLQRIQAFLEQQDKSQLVGHLLDIIEHDDHLQDVWSIKADVALGKIDIKGLKKRITAAFPTGRHLHHYPQVRSYFQKAEPVVELLAQQFDALPAEKAVELVEYALDRLQKALQTVDDSGGFRDLVETRLQQLHVAAVTRLPWDKARLAHYLFTQHQQPDRDLYPAIPDAYVDALGEAGMQHYHDLARIAWDALPQLTERLHWKDGYDYFRLSGFLLKWAEAHQDFEGALAIKLKQACQQIDFLRITEYCIEHQQWDHARRWLTKAKTFKQERNGWHPVLELERLEQAILLHDGNVVQALTLQWDIFTRSALLADYQRLLKLEQQAGARPAYAGQARAFLQEQMQKSGNALFKLRYSNNLLEICLYENDLASALAVVQHYQVDPGLLHQLAQAFADQPITAIALYERLVQYWVDKGDNKTYRQAVSLLVECRGILKVTAHQTAFDALLQRLRTDFKAKRNFMKLLADTF